MPAKKERPQVPAPGANHDNAEILAKSAKTRQSGNLPFNFGGIDLLVMPRLLNDKLSLWAARSVEPLRGLVKPRNLNCLCQLLGSLGGGKCLDD
ncbi:MAG: hypothetical protein UEP75_08280, partial [Collinsella sp.]|nr:hypothetical protein [Collinsella sp.]